MNRRNYTKLAGLGAVLVLLASTLHAQTGPAAPLLTKWKRYTVKGEEFSVMLPHVPAMTSNKSSAARVQSGEPVQKKRMERVLVAAADGVTYTVYAYENPKPRQTLEEFIREQTAKSGAANVQPVNEKFFAGEKHLYRFVATGAPAEHMGVMLFFASIQMGKDQEGMQVVDGPGIAIEAPTELGEIYVGRAVDVKARLLNKPEPSYTAVARKKKITGTVVLKCVFASNGTVTNFRVVEELPYGLTEKAIEAAKKIKFIPAMKSGHPVSMWMQLEYNFNLY